MRILAIDYGDKRIGLAISDALKITSQPLKTIQNQDDIQVLEEIQAIIEKYNISLIVLGLPLNMDGSEGFRVEATKDFKKVLEKEFAIPIVLEDERLSTAEVEKVLLSGDVSRAKRKETRDKLAASIILRKFLNKRKGWSNDEE